MPRLSDSMEEGVILEWLIADGMPVEEGDEIVDIETDKANMAFEAEYSGVLHHGAGPGDTVSVGAVIGSIEPAMASAAAPTAPTTQPAPRREQGAPSASPTAARLAQRIGFPLTQVSGSGPDGRVMRRDVIEAHEATSTPAPPAQATIPTAAPPPPTPAAPRQPAPGRAAAGRRMPLTRVQRLVAERMVASKSTIPDFSVTRAVNFDAVHALRVELKARGVQVPSYNDVILAAVARTLTRHPLLTAHYVDGDIVYTDQVNLSIAVATDAVLHAPVIQGADLLSLTEITAAARQLTTLARQGHLAVGDLRGGTFTVSNLGMHGASRFSAIINGAQSAILAVGAVHETVHAAGGSFTTGWMSELTLTCDHRIIYGAHAAAFLGDLEATLQEPHLLQ